MEKQISISLKDNKKLYATLNTALKPKGIIIFVHGLTGHANEHQFYNSARYFPKQGYSTLRLNLYSSQKNARKLSECTVRIHASDILKAVEKARKYHDKIHIVGHSLGGPSILLAQLQNVQSITFWDPTPTRWLHKKEPKIFIVEPKMKKVIIRWGTESLMGIKMYNETKKFMPLSTLLKNNKIPLNIITAEKGLNKQSKEYYKYTKGPRRYTIIKCAGHCFDEEGVEEKLFKRTLSWIKRFTPQ